MRALAKCIMSGRWQAIIIAFLGFPILSPAAVALVTLRRGALDGAWLLAALLFPSLLFLLVMEEGWLAWLCASIGYSVLIYLAALLIKLYGSWSLCLVLVSAIAMLGAHIVGWSIDLRQDLLGMADLTQMAESERLQFEKLVDLLLEEKVLIPGTALVLAYGVITSLLLARWWQALLYKPGGFREEFHNLRIEPKLVLFSVVLGLALMYVADSGGGMLVFMPPLVVAGLGYGHWWSSQMKMPWVLWVLYVGILVPQWTAMIMMMVMTIGMLDSILDLRKRINDMR